MGRKSLKSARTTTSSTVDTTTSPVPPPRPLNANAKTFFDLPGELRNQIYAELLPDVPDLANLPWGSGLRSDGGKTSTAFMAACKAVYEEASSVLYASLATTEDEVGVRVEGNGKIIFLRSSTQFGNLTAANFAALKRVKKLRVHVSTGSRSDYLALCNVQDAMFTALSDNLRAGHVLESLHVSISTPGPADGFLELVSSSYADYVYPRTVMREFQNIRPGADISRAHVPAFLTDPLRCIRGIKNGEKKGKFTLDFVGKSGHPWREVQEEVRGLVQGNSAVEDYNIFGEYFEAVRRLSDMGLSSVQQLAKARIQGDITGFRASLLGQAERIERKLLSGEAAKSSEGLQHDEEEAREMVHLCEVLKAKVPEVDTDTSFFGYVIADDGLREWQSHGRAAEKEAKAKRKREKQAADETERKKVKGQVGI